ncbi:hypothetical protein PHLCEN_2v4863 [Hermanssonia centrifuga]|uniref:3-demethylubiquinol 3-O-methyltransferase n=1 Tax=Hermanssonia centrifuga TaxID=98765 RepID=A0A2R6PG21_9APHY|nr:hypothetical protein PHLCEN_2v4863 [Hermanssonia centrifuga]
MNPARIQFLRDKVTEIALDDDPNASVNPTRILRGLNVLDVGCGGGLLSESLTRLGANTLGIDASASNISIASLHASADPSLNFTSGISSLLPAHTTVHRGNKAEGKGTLTYTHTSVEELLIERGEGAFDIVCSMEVIEHVDNPRDFLDSCARLVKPGGHLLLSTIARTPLAYFLTIFAAEDLLGFVSKGTHTFSKYVNPEELEGFFRSYRSQSRPWISGPVAHRLQAETRGIIFVPWNNEWVLTPRGSKWAEGCNYLFWVRRPLE